MLCAHLETFLYRSGSTWEDPDFVHHEVMIKDSFNALDASSTFDDLLSPDWSMRQVGVGGDNDPLDVCEIGLRQIPTGQVRPVKVCHLLLTSFPAHICCDFTDDIAALTAQQTSHCVLSSSVMHAFLQPHITA